MAQVAGKKAQRSKAASKAREGEEGLLQSVHANPIPTFVIDAHHAVVYCNRAFENLTGMTAQEIVGTRDQWKAFYPKRRPVLADLIVDGASWEEMAALYGDTLRPSSVVEGGYEAAGFFEIPGKGGRWLFFTAAPLRDADGRISGAIETLQDITDRKEAEAERRRSQRRVRVLLDFVPYPMVVFDLEGKVVYLNPEFTHTFGWTLEELEGRTIPYTPPGAEKETRELIRRLFEHKVIQRFETRRLTKDGRLLDVVLRAALFYEVEGTPGGELVILRDITREKRIARNNEAMLRISLGLPEYPDLEDLLDYVSREVKTLLNTEGALVLLVDEGRGELLFKGAAYDDLAAQKKVKEIRIPMDRSVAGKVVRTGQPVIVPDVSREPEFYPEVDRQLAFRTRNLLDVPLKSSDRIIGVLCARNKKDGAFDESDVELLNMIAGTVALSIENARFAEEVKKAYRTNEALLRISMALPEYPDLEMLLDFVADVVKRLVGSEGALVTLLDEETQELYFPGAAYDDRATQVRIKEIRFPVDQLVAGRVIKTGQSTIVNDATLDAELARERDRKLGYNTRNLLLVPLRSHERTIGVLCAINKKEGGFTQGDSQILNMIAGTLALSVENARFAEELKQAYREVSSMNRAKDKVINHLSHELKTPLAILSGSLNILSRHLGGLPEESWKPAMERASRNLHRLVEIQNEVEDIMRDKQYRMRDFLLETVEECADQLATMVEEYEGKGPLIQFLKERIEEIYGSREPSVQVLHLDSFLKERVEAARKAASGRQLEIVIREEAVPPLLLPLEPIQKAVDGLIRNAIENTPDEGRIEVMLRATSRGVELGVRDYGVGIREEDQARIFEGFFTTRDTMTYSSKTPYAFNAGGKGADLLRIRIFSERYGFRVEMASVRCPVIPREEDQCPGRISLCPACSNPSDCHERGGSLFTLIFPRSLQAPSLGA